MSLICDIPIPKTGQRITIDQTPRTLKDMGVSFVKGVQTVKISFYERPELRVIARFAADPSATISPTVGNVILPNDVFEMNKFGLDALFVAAEGSIQAHVTQFTGEEECDFTNEYRNLIARVLPSEPEYFGSYGTFAAKYIPESNLYKLFNSFGKVFSDFHCRVLDMILEMFASTSTELANNWANETFSDTLNNCLEGFGITTQDKVAAAVAKLHGIGANSTEGYIDVAEALGLEISITDDVSTFSLTINFINPDLAPRLACDLACASMLNGPDLNSILAFRCIMKIIGPAQSDIVYQINGDCEFE